MLGGTASRYFGQRGTVAPSVLFAHCTWMVWSAMTSNPKVGCAPIQYDGTPYLYLPLQSSTHSTKLQLPRDCAPSSVACIFFLFLRVSCHALASRRWEMGDGGGSDAHVGVLGTLSWSSFCGTLEVVVGVLWRP